MESQDLTWCPEYFSVLTKSLGWSQATDHPLPARVSRRGLCVALIYAVSLSGDTAGKEKRRAAINYPTHFLSSEAYSVDEPASQYPSYAQRLFS